MSEEEKVIENEKIRDAYYVYSYEILFQEYIERM
jgi:hypothetical protein